MIHNKFYLPKVEHKEIVENKQIITARSLAERYLLRQVVCPSVCDVEVGPIVIMYYRLEFCENNSTDD